MRRRRARPRRSRADEDEETKTTTTARRRPRPTCLELIVTSLVDDADAVRCRCRRAEEPCQARGSGRPRRHGSGHRQAWTRRRRDPHRRPCGGRSRWRRRRCRVRRLVDSDGSSVRAADVAGASGADRAGAWLAGGGHRHAGRPSARQRLDPGIGAVDRSTASSTVLASRPSPEGLDRGLRRGVDAATRPKRWRGTVLRAEAVVDPTDDELWVHELVGATRRAGRRHSDRHASRRCRPTRRPTCSCSTAARWCRGFRDRSSEPGRIVIDPPEGLLEI